MSPRSQPSSAEARSRRTKKARRVRAFYLRTEQLVRFGAGDGGRTRKGKARGILSPLRLPVSPRPHAFPFKHLGDSVKRMFCSDSFAFCEFRSTAVLAPSSFPANALVTFVSFCMWRVWCRAGIGYSPRSDPSDRRRMINTTPIMATKSNAFCWPFHICDCHIANHSPPMAMKPAM